MKKLIATIPFVLVALGGYFYQDIVELIQKDSTRYFYQITFDGKGNLVGKYETDAKSCEKTACYNFYYSEDGSLNSIIYLRNGKYENDDYLEVAVTVFDYGEGYKKRYYYDQTGKPGFDDDGVQAELLTYDAENDRLLTLHYDEYGYLMQNRWGVYGYSSELDENGFKAANYRLDENLEQIEDVNGVYKKSYLRDKNGYILEWKNLDKEEKIIPAADDGVAVVKYKRNSFGDPLEAQYFDGENKSFERTTDGLAKIQWDYTDKGEDSEARYYGADGDLKLDGDSGYAVIKYQHDQYGNIMEEAYFDAALNPVADNRDGTAVWRWERDDNGNTTTLSYFDADNQPVEKTDDGIAKIKFVWSPQRDITEETYYGANGELKIDTELGFAIKRTKHNLEREYLEESFYSADESLVADSNGIAMTTWERSETTMKKSFFDENNDLINHPELGYAVEEYKRNPDDSLLHSPVFFDAEGKVVEVEA